MTTTLPSPSPPTELSLLLPQGRFAALAWGPPDGVPVLAFHGWLDNAASFARLAPWLPEVRLVAVDLAGHGNSDHRPPGLAYHLLDSAHDAVGIARALGWERYTLLGHSLGGVVSSLVAAGSPGGIERLVLLESLGALTAPDEEFPKRLRDLHEAWIALEAKRLPVYSTLEQAVLARAKAGDLTEAGARTLVERGVREVPGGLTWKSDPRLRLPTAQRLTEAQVEAALKAIVAPTLLVVGTEGLLPLRRAMAPRAQCVASLHVVHVAGGHHVHIDFPERVAPALREFLGLGGSDCSQK